MILIGTENVTDRISSMKALEKLSGKDVLLWKETNDESVHVRFKSGEFCIRLLTVYIANVF